jgi:methionine-rich copper-binding protein CopC
MFKLPTMSSRGAAFALLLLLGSTGQGLAHAKLLSATPARDQIAMPPPTELRLKFSEAIERRFAKVKVTCPDGKIINTGPIKLDPEDKTTVIVPMSDPLRGQEIHRRGT